MKPLILYLAGPIDLGKDIPNWRADLMKLIQLRNITATAFDPSTAFKTSKWGTQDKARSLYIEQMNRVALDSANIFVAMLPKAVSTIGTPIEIEFAAKSSGIKHIYLISDIQPGASVYLDNRVPVSNWFSPVDMYSQDNVIDTLNSLVDQIVRDAVEMPPLTKFVED